MKFFCLSHQPSAISEILRRMPLAERNASNPSFDALRLAPNTSYEILSKPLAIDHQPPALNSEPTADD
jgi:hypothetical protein